MTMHLPRLLTPLNIKSILFKNRIWISPMCQYSSLNGHPTDWHLVHLGSRAVGGAGLVMVEATAVTPEGRISPDDSGIWSDEHIPSFKKLADFIKDQGAVSGIQIAHAGRKGSVAAPWLGGAVLSNAERGWETIAPSAIAFQDGNVLPREMTKDDIQQIIAAFADAAKRCLAAGFQVLELHMAHGYLMHQFLSPLSNHRQDEYGGSLENRLRFPLAAARAVREVWPQTNPLFARISATDWADNPDEGWRLPDAIHLSHQLKMLGIDLIDCSSGGTLARPKIPLIPGYQVPFSDQIRKEVDIMTTAVGLITEAEQAEAILVQEQADAIFIARESLRNPYWPQQVAKTLGAEFQKPVQYGRS